MKDEHAAVLEALHKRIAAYRIGPAALVTNALAEVANRVGEHLSKMLLALDFEHPDRNSLRDLYLLLRVLAKTLPDDTHAQTEEGTLPLSLFLDFLEEESCPKQALN